jgi:enoyl-[acyl-carrier protein] reductase I
MGMFSGKKGLVLGIANDFSIAWAITRKLLDEGAEIGFTHLPGDKMERRVRKLVDPVGAKLVTSCDVQKDEDVARTFDQAREIYGALDFVLHSIAFAPIDDLKCPYVNCSREGFKTAMDISVYSLVAVSRHAAKVLNEGSSIVTLTYLGGERVVPGYNMMGVCKAALDASVKYLAYDLGPKKIRVNAVSAGPVKTLAASAVGDFEKLAGLYEMSAPLDRNVEREEVGAAALFLLSDLASGITGEKTSRSRAYEQLMRWLTDARGHRPDPQGRSVLDPATPGRNRLCRLLGIPRRKVRAGGNARRSGKAGVPRGDRPRRRGRFVAAGH